MNSIPPESTSVDNKKLEQFLKSHVNPIFKTNLVMLISHKFDYKTHLILNLLLLLQINNVQK
jgi:hypothetical protein